VVVARRCGRSPAAQFVVPDLLPAQVGALEVASVEGLVASVSLTSATFSSVVGVKPSYGLLGLVMTVLRSWALCAFPVPTNGPIQ
jgi:hypothetical protein